MVIISSPIETVLQDHHKVYVFFWFYV